MSTSSSLEPTSSRLSNKGSISHKPIHHNLQKYYIPTLTSTHLNQYDYGKRVNAYKYF